VTEPQPSGTAGEHPLIADPQARPDRALTADQPDRCQLSCSARRPPTAPTPARPTAHDPHPEPLGDSLGQFDRPQPRVGRAQAPRPHCCATTGASRSSTAAC